MFCIKRDEICSLLVPLFWRSSGKFKDCFLFGTARQTRSRSEWGTVSSFLWIRWQSKHGPGVRPQTEWMWKRNPNFYLTFSRNHEMYIGADYRHIKGALRERERQGRRIENQWTAELVCADRHLENQQLTTVVQLLSLSLSAHIFSSIYSVLLLFITCRWYILSTAVRLLFCFFFSVSDFLFVIEKSLGHSGENCRERQTDRQTDRIRRNGKTDVGLLFSGLLLVSLFCCAVFGDLVRPSFT